MLDDKLSDDLAELSVKTKALEDKFAAAKKENHEQIESKKAEVKADVLDKKEKLSQKMESAKDRVEDKNDEIKSSFQTKMDHIKADIQARKAERKAKVDEGKHKWSVHEAQRHYDNAIEDAEYAVAWAEAALSEVEEAMLNALTADLELTRAKNS